MSFVPRLFDFILVIVILPKIPNLDNNIFIPVTNSCDAEATAVPNGGVIPYTYIWQDPSSQITQTATGLCPGFVTLTLQDNRGCTVTDSILINNPPQMQLASVPVSASCNQADGGATVSVVANGTAPFTYEWSTDGVTVIDTNATLTNVMAGTYYATVFDSLGCSVIDTVVIPNASGPVIDSLNSTNVLCFGQIMVMLKFLFLEEQLLILIYGMMH